MIGRYVVVYPLSLKFLDSSHSQECESIIFFISHIFCIIVLMFDVVIFDILELKLILIANNKIHVISTRKIYI